jgi:hypothetical protein
LALVAIKIPIFLRNYSLSGIKQPPFPNNQGDADTVGIPHRLPGKVQII